MRDLKWKSRLECVHALPTPASCASIVFYSGDHSAQIVGQPILAATGFQPATGVSTFFCDFPSVRAINVGRALSPANPVCSTAENFPTGIPTWMRQPSCLLLGVWMGPSRRFGGRRGWQANLRDGPIQTP